MRAAVAAAAPRRAKSIWQYEWAGALPFIAVHLACIGIFFTGVTWQALLVCAASYVLRMFGVTAGYHRYFSHRTFKTNRLFQFMLAFLAQTSSQRGVLWWAAHHRDHHDESDQPLDLHSPVQRGLLYAHCGWIFDYNGRTKLERIKDFAKYPELVWLDKYWVVPPVVLGLVTLLLGGWTMFLVGFCLSTVLLWHGTFTINSLSHVIGSRRYKTTDDSRNNFVLAMITLGEGWHNNHHHYMHSTRQGFFWWELDLTYFALRVLGWLRVVRDFKAPPEWAVRGFANARVFAEQQCRAQASPLPDAFLLPSVARAR